MDKLNALASLSALSQDTRLDAFRLLIRAGKEGLPAGEISDRLDVRQNTMSAHLSVLHQAGLIQSTRDGRSIRYTADMAAMRGLVAYLLEDCCGGAPDTCKTLLDTITC